MAGHVELLLNRSDCILITGANGFIGSRVVAGLLDRGFSNLRCLVRPSGNANKLLAAPDGASIDVISGNLLSPEDCRAAVKDASVVYHLAAARGEKSFPDAFMNSVVTTRNLLEAAVDNGCLKRFVNVSSFAVYSNRAKPSRRVLDETCPVERQPHLRGEAYCFAKVRQDDIVEEYGRTRKLPYVIVRPGYVYGPGNEAISSRVGISTFGVFLHLGGGNTIPLTYVENCVDAILRAGMLKGVDGEIFNVVDDDVPTSRLFLREYKRHVRKFRSWYVPHPVSYALCFLWERYSTWSQGQLPPAFNTRCWHAYWKQTRYSNDKLKTRLGWQQPVPTAEGLRRYFQSCRARDQHA